MKIKHYLLTGFLLFFVIQHVHGGWLNRKAEGWFWYEDREKEEELDKMVPQEYSTPLITKPSLTATEEMSLIRKELEERLNRAVLEPTENNVMAYMQMQQKWIYHSSQFSQAWLKNLLNHPQLDSRNDSPITQYGVQIQKQIVREKREKSIRSLAQSYGLFFFYEGKSKISQAFSFVVKEFAKKYDWQLFAISCDGVLIPGIENNQMDSGITQRLGVEIFPALFLVEPSRKSILPIAFGLSSVDQIEDNIETQLKNQVDLL